MHEEGSWMAWAWSWGLGFWVEGHFCSLKRSGWHHQTVDTKKLLNLFQEQGDDDVKKNWGKGKQCLRVWNRPASETPIQEFYIFLTSHTDAPAVFNPSPTLPSVASIFTILRPSSNPVLRVGRKRWIRTPGRKHGFLDITVSSSSHPFPQVTHHDLLCHIIDPLLRQLFGHYTTSV